jgi:hypothetical protein
LEAFLILARNHSQGEERGQLKKTEPVTWQDAEKDLQESI